MNLSLYYDSDIIPNRKPGREITMEKLKAHLFICTSCTYKKDNGQESSPEEAIILRKNLKNRARELYPKNEVKVSASTCLGTCEFGISSVLYPKGEWNLGLRPDMEDEMLEKIAEEVSRLK